VDDEDGGEREVSRSELVKGYEYEKGRFLVLESADLHALKAQTTREMQILEFVRLAEVDPIYFETSYYVAPDEAGERAYSLLFEAMRTAGFVAIAQFAMHNREHTVILRSGRRGLILHTLFYNDEIRSDLEFRADSTALNPRELDMARSLVEALSGPFEPAKYKDNYRERLEGLLEAKMAGRQIAEAAPVRAKAPVDLMKALESSLAAAASARKPAASAPATTAGAPARPKRKSSGKG
jgi:DNA end-binding protein Ku